MHEKLIEQLINGMRLIEDAVDIVDERESEEKIYARDTLKDTLLDILCGVGVHQKGYTNEKYFFEISFDEELARMESWTDDIFDFEAESEEWNEHIDWDNIHYLVKGFEQSILALGRLVGLSRLDSDTRKILLQKEEEYGYSPFKQYGIVSFERLFKSFKQAYFKEVKEAIGKKAFETKKQEVCNRYYQFEENGKTMMLVHNPCTLLEENDRIELFNEDDDTDEPVAWYEKNALHSISQKEYEAWYLEHVIKRFVSWDIPIISHSMKTPDRTE